VSCCRWATTFGLSTAAWSPLAAGLLTGKFTRGDHDGPSRVDRASVKERDLTIARAVDAVADELGTTSSRVALAWTRAHRPTVHPIIGARRLDQLTDNLAAVDLELPAEVVRRLDEVSAIEPGFPHDFMASTREFVFGTTEPVARA
jgi:aryl-alcohol dehydrogenase-like predicted oxidoreductase